MDCRGPGEATQRSGFGVVGEGEITGGCWSNQRQLAAGLDAAVVGGGAKWIDSRSSTEEDGNEVLHPQGRSGSINPEFLVCSPSCDQSGCPGYTIKVD